MLHGGTHARWRSSDVGDEPVICHTSCNGAPVTLMFLSVSSSSPCLCFLTLPWSVSSTLLLCCALAPLLLLSYCCSEHCGGAPVSIPVQLRAARSRPQGICGRTNTYGGHGQCGGDILRVSAHGTLQAALLWLKQQYGRR